VTLDRIIRLQKILEPDQYFYISNLINVRYLSGFSGSNAALLVGKSTATLVTDSRYEIQASEQVPDVETVIGRNFPDLLLRKIVNSEIFVEGDTLSVNSYQNLSDMFRHKFTRTSGVVESFRSVKDNSEVELIKTACEIAESAFLDVIESIKIGQSEKHIRNALERRMRELGADDIAFKSIVAAGTNSAIPHHEPTDLPVEIGDFLKIDFGAKLSGYHSDCTRTVILGKPADWQIDLHSAVSAAQFAGRNEIRAQIRFSDVERVVNGSLADSGYREFFTHGLGHGVGLEIHEEPFFGRAGDAKIASNTVITIEPGAYLKDKGGVRVEDTIVVHSQGYQNLTNLPYELLEI